MSFTSGGIMPQLPAISGILLHHVAHRSRKDDPDITYRTIAYLFQKFSIAVNDRRMPYSTAARLPWLASWVSWFRFRATPFSWAMKSSVVRGDPCSTTVQVVDQLAQDLGRRLPASRQRAEKRSFRSGLSRVLTTMVDAADADLGRPPPPYLLYVFFGVEATGCFDRLFMLYIVQTSGIYAGQRERRSCLRKHNLCLP